MKVLPFAVALAALFVAHRAPGFTAHRALGQEEKSESVTAGEALLAEVARVYAEAPALTDHVKLESKGPMGERTEELSLRLEGADAVITVADLTVTAVKGVLYVEKAGVPEKYAEFAVAGDLVGALQGSVGVSPPQLLARSGGGDAAGLLQAWVFGFLMSPQVTAYALRSVEGVEMHEVTVKGPNGDAVLLIDSSTKLVGKVTVHIAPPGAPEGSDVHATLTFSPKITSSLAPPIAFVPGDREKVTDMGGLKPDLKGKPAPDFTLETLDGSRVTLSELKGSVVVLDFWAMWCAPCKQSLPELQAFATWVRHEGVPVKVFAVDVWERETREAVEAYWKTNAYTIPVLRDADSVTPGPYLFDSIPFTVVIDPEGVVFSVHSGAEEGMLGRLRREVEEILTREGK